MSPDTKEIEVQQTVHGYRDGHELLASSVQLSSAARRILLALSDLSGDGNPRNFDCYLTGYPLEEVGLYAFARTWYAHEMSRPGCVWTHTLLIAFDDLWLIEDLGTLRDHFHRPESEQIPANLSGLRHSISAASSRSVRLDGASYEIVIRLYGQDLPILIFADSAAQYEQTAIEVWNQQWTRLRSTFSFCTGALEPRFLERRPLDLQVVPQQRQRRMLRSADKFSVISAEDLMRSTEFTGRLRETVVQLASGEKLMLTVGHPLQEDSEVPASSDVCPLWQDIVIQDLIHRNRKLHKFVEEYSVDIEPRRTAYRDLIECWAVIETLDGAGTSLRDLTRTLAKAFPKSSDAGALKRAVLGPDSIVRGAREAELVHELLTLPVVGAFDVDDLNLSARAEHLFRDGKRWRASAIAWLLTADTLNDTGRVWSRSVLENLSIEDVTGVFAEDRELFSRLLIQRPSLARQDGLWRQPRELQRAAVQTLHTIKDEDVLQGIVTAIVAANASGLVDALIQQLGSGIVLKVLNGVDKSRGQLNDFDEWQWTAQLRAHDAEVLRWLDSVETAHSWTLAFAVSLVGLYSNALARASNSTFFRHLTGQQNSVVDEWSTDYSAYCLAIGLRNFNGDAGQLAVLAFDPVHHAALRTKLSRRAWQWLGPDLPRPGWFEVEEWDDGEKLRRALVDAFIRHQWAPSLLPQALTDEQTRRWVIRYCDSFTYGQELLRAAGLAWSS